MDGDGRGGGGVLLLTMVRMWMARSAARAQPRRESRWESRRELEWKWM